MRFALLMALGLLWLPSSAAMAQEASVSETRCWMGNVAFSAGIGMNAGNGTAVCNAGTGWAEAKADTAVAGCLLEGKLSSAGAIVGIRNNAAMLLKCDVTGRWVTIEAVSKE